MLKIYRSTESLDGAQRSSDFLAQHGLLYERVDAARCVELEPALRRHGADAWRERSISRATRSATATSSRKALAAACAARGVRFHYGDDGHSDRDLGGRVTGVVTNKGRIAADTVVVAMGSFTAPLLAKLGIRVPIYPVKGISITFPRGAWNRRRKCRSSTTASSSASFRSATACAFPGSAEITGYDATPAHAARPGDHRQCQLHLPGTASGISIWRRRESGPACRPVSPAGTPIIGQTPQSRASGSMPATAISAGRSPAARAGSPPI